MCCLCEFCAWKGGELGFGVWIGVERRETEKNLVYLI